MPHSVDRPNELPQRFVPLEIRREGLIVGSDGNLYPPQKDVEGRERVVALLAEEYLSTGDALRRVADRLCPGCVGRWTLVRVGEHWFHNPPSDDIDPDYLCGASAVWNEDSARAQNFKELTEKILATVNLNGNKVCTCLHVEGGSDPAHGHGYYQCETCGGLCCSERWAGQAVQGLRWMELMMQQHRHSQIVVRGLNFIQERLQAGVTMISERVPREQQKAAVLRLIARELANLSHIWFQSSMGDYLYQTGEQRGGPTTARIYEEPAGELAEKLAMVTGGATPEAFLERFGYADALTPAQALARAMPKEAKERYALDAPTAMCWCGHAAHLGSCTCGCNAVFSSHVDHREKVEVLR